MIADTDNNTRLTVLHDHYKESFTHIRDWEKQRDRNFLIIIAIIALLFFEVLYPTNLQTAIESTRDYTVGINFNAFPLHVLISLTWTMLAAISLRYCQSLTHIERQYEYVHSLENVIASYFGDLGSVAYRREGRNYLNMRTIFSDWAWVFYTFMFPSIVIITTGCLYFIEIMHITGSFYHFIYDAIVGLIVWASFLFYKLAQWHDAKAINGIR